MAKQFNPKWITQGADKEMTEFASEKANEIRNLETTQFRNIYGEIKRIQSNYEQNSASVFLLKPKVAYACARAQGYKKQLLRKFKDEVFDKAIDFATDKEKYSNFCSYIEAILAYHRFFSDKEVNKENKN